MYTYIWVLLLELSWIACICKCRWAFSLFVFCLSFLSFPGKTAETSCRSKKFDSCSDCRWSHPPNAWEEGLFAIPNKKCCYSGINVIARYLKKKRKKIRKWLLLVSCLSKSYLGGERCFELKAGLLSPMLFTHGRAQRTVAWLGELLSSWKKKIAAIT